MSTVEKLHTPEFQIVSKFFRAANPRGVTGTGTRGLPSRAFACTSETPEPRRGQNQRSGHATDCRDGRRRIRNRAVQARGRWQQRTSDDSANLGYASCLEVDPMVAAPKSQRAKHLCPAKRRTQFEPD